MVKKPENDICRLCGETRVLVRSHIVPEFLHRDLYDERSRAAALRPLMGKQHPIQKGLREKLLCFECEQFLNDRFEKPFLAMWRDGNMRPELLPPGKVYVVNGLDYAKAKLFLLSVLWRASVATRDEFSLDLGPHGARIKRMILDEDAGDVERYPIVGTFAVDEVGNLLPFVSSPMQLRLFGHHACAFGLGGCEWTFFTSSHPVKQARGIGLQPRGPSFFAAQLLRDLRTFSAVRTLADRRRGRDASPQA